MNADQDRTLTQHDEGAAGAAAARFARRVALSHLVDLSYTVAASPLGDLLLVRSRVGLMRVGFLDGSPDLQLDELARDVSPSIVAARVALEPWLRELDEYFAGSRIRFEAPLDTRRITGFQQRILDATAAIDFGTTATYAAVATRAGSAHASRAAGNALGANPLPVVIPCHRVVRTSGGLGGYAGGLERKRRLLALERATRPPTPTG